MLWTIIRRLSSPGGLGIVIVTLAASVLGCVASQRPIARSVRCGERMKQVCFRIYDYTKTNGDIPRDSRSNASLAPLISNGLLDFSDVKCTRGNVFIINPTLTSDQVLNREMAARTTMLVHNAASLHEGNYAVFVRADCIVIIRKVEATEYREWLNRFMEGESNLDLPGRK